MADQGYQWTKPCNICEGPVQYHCNTCGDELCATCKDNHLKSNAKKTHNVVHYTEKVAQLQTSSLKCQDHPGDECRLWCKTCGKAVCTECVASLDHQGHYFDKLSAKLEEKRELMQKEFHLRRDALKKLEELEEKDKQMTVTYTEDMDSIDSELTARADSICKEVHEILGRERKQLQECKTNAITKLQNQERTLAEDIESAKEGIKSMEKNLRSGEPAVLLQYKAEDLSSYQSSLPALAHVSAPVYQRDPVDIAALEKVFGRIVDRDESESGSDTVDLDLSHSSVRESDTEKSEGYGPLITNPSIFSRFKTEMSPRAIPFLACEKPGLAWVRNDFHIIQLVDRGGEVKDTIKLNFNVRDIALTSKGEILINDYENTNIKVIAKDKSMKTLIKSRWEPWSLCCLDNDDLLVTFRDDERVILYNSAGGVIKELDSSPFRYPRCIAQNKLTKDIYICDKVDKINIHSLGKVLIFNEDIVLKGEYAGQDKDTFTPVTICSDTQGHVLITDYNNDVVHILDKDCNFLHYLQPVDPGLRRPFAVDTDADGFAWIVEWKSKEVKVVKYLK